MSSHHVIREGQEPAIYLRNSSSVILKVLHNLLEWSPYLIVNSDTLVFCKDHGIKPDAIVCETENEVDFFIEIIPHLDTLNDLDQIKKWLKSRNCDQLLIFEDMNNLKQLISTDPLFGVIDRNIKYSMIRERILKWFPEGQKLFLVNTESKQNMEFTNLKKNNQALIVINTGLVNIHSNNPFYLGELLE
ncbi:hypothetical protein OO013_12200 [Mangrovivirga sp. M17]|uniref:Thiamine pyrophosphokinase n=1 Tax=Mangrovivirga halotolerans TaxID=2993936 RepID=A0ABT3RS70_9BACT|nr:hypothetical protein [Mangrovivirga halotolerans]MCX2744635.1 hypothetical protein [Mangrovivirga halotolerans]